MFTGIVTEIGSICSIIRDDDTLIEILVAFETEKIVLGTSISCAGVCLTVTDKRPGRFFVGVSSETLSRTTIGSWREGTKVNIEKSMIVGGEIAGHLVSGHVDGIGKLSEKFRDGGSIRMLFEAPHNIVHLIAEKGSITIDGASMTVNSVTGNKFGVNIIEHTLKETTLGNLNVGDGVNIEVDILARYIERLLKKRD